MTQKAWPVMTRLDGMLIVLPTLGPCYRLPLPSTTVATTRDCSWQDLLASLATIIITVTSITQPHPPYYFIFSSLYLAVNVLTSITLHYVLQSWGCKSDLPLGSISQSSATHLSRRTRASKAACPVVTDMETTV